MKKGRSHMTIYKVTNMKDGRYIFVKDRKDVKTAISTSENTMVKVFAELQQRRMVAVRDFLIEKVELTETLLNIVTTNPMLVGFLTRMFKVRNGREEFLEISSNPH